ncbi:uncharacterized mitochondrial protein AtMg00810-like [Rutidosis leptorrhynchoides]|uniref:uncharacterized mitochondrial protein AtMg00810-like n=1 Tax=Rutidosis leptorrhynchoides TaxID=125765 RepID=UPI003A9A3547
MKDLGELSYFLGLEVFKSEHGIFVSQRKYTLDLLKEASVQNMRPYKLPMNQNIKLTAEVVQLLSFMHNPTSVDMQAVKHLLWYLLLAPYQGIILAKRSAVQLKAYGDSDWASFSMIRRSTTCFCMEIKEAKFGLSFIYRG